MKRAVFACTALAARAALSFATPAGAATTHRHPHAPSVQVLSSDLTAPYQLDAAHGSIFVGDGGTSSVKKYSHGRLSTLAQGPSDGNVSGVAVNRRGDLAYTSSVGDENGITVSQLTVQPRYGRSFTVDLKGYEAAHNPDAGISYGIDNPTECQAAAFEPLGGATYEGLVDSHAYAVTAAGRDSWIVADAGGNDLLKVDRHGRVSTIAVLPRQATTITAAAAAGLGLPDCVVGAVYNFESVPTDVEWAGRDLVGSLLPGGPEDPSLGARGSVYRVSPSSGHASFVAGGFLGATNVAVGPRDRIYVAELFAGKISVIDHGTVKPYADLPGALSLVWSKGALYAGTIGNEDPPAPGTLVRIS